MDEYEITISVNGMHWGRVTLPSDTPTSAAIAKATLLQRALSHELRRAPPSSAVVCSVTRWQRIGYPIDVEDA